MDQVIQLIGALLILVAFVAAQRGSMAPTSRRYLALNFVGSAVLGILALRGHQWGFVLLETAWAVVSGWGLMRTLTHS